jgi:alpha-L-fucosidase 2
LWKNIAYARPGGRDLLMDAFIPEGAGPFPAVIIAHGGGWEAGDKVTYVAPLFAPLAHAGFAWFSIDHRLTPHVRVPEQVEDIRAAVAYIRRHAGWFHVDPKRIALVGESASGQLVMLAAGDARAVVSFYGVYDFLPWANDPGRRPTLDRLFDKWDAETLRHYSPLHQVRSDLPPVLLIQGTQDRLYEGTLAYAARLKQAGAKHELLVLDGAPHGLENWGARWRFYQDKLIAWLRDVLR